MSPARSRVRLPRPVVRRAGADDIPAMLRIEQRSNPVPWSRQLFAKELERREGATIVATDFLGRPAAMPVSDYCVSTKHASIGDWSLNTQTQRV
ncbi:MAG: hypothetical protein ACPG7S_06655, partial [Miltoncostaeaceae bacterium]